MKINSTNAICRYVLRANTILPDAYHPIILREHAESKPDQTKIKMS